MENRKQKLMKFLEESPKDVFLWYALAMEELKESPQQAKSLLLKCLEIEPSHIPSHYQLALLADQAGEEEEAIAFLDKGLQFLKSSSDEKTKREFLALRSIISGG
ncbi:MAG: tetratricopeptide repeat protein [Bacteroidetes bacterium]|nr:tetratricopeptide repeat protein [Bacteroidota bacterium]